MPDRSSGRDGLYHSYAAEVNEFLVQLNECSKRKILVIGATNNLRKIDRAILRPGRMDKKVFIGPPDLEARAEALRFSIEDRPHSRIDWVAVAGATQDFSFAELEHIANESARAALTERRDIATWDLLAAAQANPPSPKEKAEDEPPR